MGKRVFLPDCNCGLTKKRENVLRAWWLSTGDFARIQGTKRHTAESTFKEKAEYSLEEVSQPIGIAGYELSNALSKEYQRSLPTIETLESEVAKMMDIK